MIDHFVSFERVFEVLLILNKERSDEVLEREDTGRDHFGNQLSLQKVEHTDFDIPQAADQEVHHLKVKVPCPRIQRDPDQTLKKQKKQMREILNKGIDKQSLPGHPRSEIESEETLVNPEAK